MFFWQLATWVAWGLSALILGWMLLDLVRVGREYDEEFLLSAREGSDDLLEEYGERGAGA